MSEDQPVQPRVLTTLTVGRRTYRKVSRKDRRRRLEYSHPELPLSNRWLEAAGVRPGDRVYVIYVKPGHLVIRPAPPVRSNETPAA